MSYGTTLYGDEQGVISGFQSSGMRQGERVWWRLLRAAANGFRVYGNLEMTEEIARYTGPRFWQDLPEGPGAEFVTGVEMSDSNARKNKMTYQPVLGLRGDSFVSGRFDSLTFPAPLVDPFVARLYGRVADVQDGQEDYVSGVSLLAGDSRYPRITDRLPVLDSLTATGFVVYGIADNGAGLLVAVGQNAAGTMSMWATSTNGGATWNTGQIQTRTNIPTSIVWVPWASLFVIAGLGGAGGVGISTSPDGETWTKRNDTNATRVAVSPNEVLVTNLGGIVYRSTNGTTYSSVKSGGGSFRCVTYTGNRWWVAGDSGRVSSSTTGESGTWTDHTAIVAATINDLTVFNGKVIAVTSNNRVYSSDDSTSPAWNLDHTAASPLLRARGMHTRVVVSGDSGVLSASANLSSWTSIAHGLGSVSILGLTYIPASSLLYVSGGTGGAFLRTADKLRLTAYPTPANRTAGTSPSGTVDFPYASQPGTATITGKLVADIDDLTPALLASARDFDVLRSFKLWKDEADRTNDAPPDWEGEWSPGVNSAPYVETLDPNTASVNHASGDPATFDFDAVFRGTITAYANDTDRAAGTNPLGSGHYAFVDLPTSVEIES